MEEMFQLKTKVYFSKGSLSFLTKLTGTRAFLVSDPVMEKLGYLQQATDYLHEANIMTASFTGIKPDPDLKLIAEGIKLYNEFSPDILIAIGGGSAIDTAKAILYFTKNMARSSGADYLKPLFLAVPSTSGTGSEVTDFSVVTTSNEKTVIIDESMAPDIAILDSTCTATLPKHIIADTGIDVLVHAIEAFVSTKANDFTDALAEKSIRLIFENLELLYNNPENDLARDHVQNASCLAGIAFNNAGLGINHSLSHALGATFHLAHGRCNALLMGEVIKYNAELSRDASSDAASRYAKLAAFLQLPARTPREGTVQFIMAVNKLKKSMEMEDTVRQLGIPEADFNAAIEQMTDAAWKDRCTSSNPRDPTKEDLARIFQSCY